MDAWLIRLCVSNNVEIVEDYEQCLDPMALGDDLTSSGWCLGMVLHWLRAKRRTEDFWNNFHNLNGKSQVRFVMARQALCSRKGSRKDVEEKMQEELRKEKLRLQSSESESVAHISAANLYNSLSKAKGRYISLVIGGTGGSHALGILISQTQLVFMDPNAGEFVFPSRAAFRAWLPMFLTGQNYFGSGMLSNYQMDAFG